MSTIFPGYIPKCEQEEVDVDLIDKYHEMFGDIWTRDNTLCHLTSSAFIVNDDYTKVLVIYHNIYNSWSWTGGHADGETDPEAVALREAQEETGVHAVPVHPGKIYSLECLYVMGHEKRGVYVPCHLHLNLTYLLEADDGETLTINQEENSGVRWFTNEEALVKPTEPWMVERVYRKLIERTAEEAKKILLGLRSKYESHHKLTISDEAVESAINMSIRYINDRFLPDKAIDLIDEAAARLRLKIFTSPPEHREMESELRRIESEKAEAITEQNFEAAAALRDREIELREKYGSAKAEWERRKTDDDLTLRECDIADIVTQWTGIPVSRLMENESAVLSSLEERLSELVIGQNDAIRALSSAIRRGRTGLKDPTRPIGSFIFAGQTGVGKTELCRALASCLFGSRDAMIRLDMSEYMEKHSVSKLIGSPPGYVGYDEGGHLTEKIRRHPYSILLFDEIEKAHPDVFGLLLQILDDGILTDSQGRRVDFKNSIIIMTTNLGAKTHGEVGSLGFTADSEKREDVRAKQRVDEALKRHFRPEFLNRVDEIIYFSPLSREDLKKIAALLLSSVADRIEESGVFIEFDDSVVDAIVGYDHTPEYGARPLRRSITALVETPYSEALLGGEFSEGDFIVAKSENGRVFFEKKKK